MAKEVEGSNAQQEPKRSGRRPKKSGGEDHDLSKGGEVDPLAVIPSTVEFAWTSVPDSSNPPLMPNAEIPDGAEPVPIPYWPQGSSSPPHPTPVTVNEYEKYGINQVQNRSAAATWASTYRTACTTYWTSIQGDLATYQSAISTLNTAYVTYGANVLVAAATRDGTIQSATETYLAAVSDCSPDPPHGVSPSFPDGSEELFRKWGIIYYESNATDASTWLSSYQQAIETYVTSVVGYEETLVKAQAAVPAAKNTYEANVGKALATFRSTVYSAVETYQGKVCSC